MDTLLDAALVGTARQPDPPRATGTPIDTLLADLPALTVERDVLLAAGALAIYRNAGRLAATDQQRPAACPDEPRPALEGHRASVAGDLLSGRPPAGPHDPGNAAHERFNTSEILALLPEAMALVDQSGCRLPHHLLTQALAMQTPEARAAVLPVLGARGRWLAQFNPAWHWAASPAGAAPVDPEATWHEGTAAQRLAALQQTRGVRPAAAREWLAATWNSEKADFRYELLGVLASGLSPDDEPFLDEALRDRSDKVRERAADLLLRLPGSALFARLIAVGDACLSYTPPANGSRGMARTFGEGRRQGKIEVLLPEEDNVAWGQIGIFERPKDDASAGKRAWYLARVLSLIPPSHWCDRFGAGPGQLIAAAATEWAQTLIESWTRAAIRHGASEWITVFWQWWSAHAEIGDTQQGIPGEMGALFRALPRDAAEAAIARLFKRDAAKATSVALELLAHLPGPWGAAVGNAYVDMLIKVAGQLPHGVGTPRAPWLDIVFFSIGHAARRLPPESWGAVPASWDLPDDPSTQQWRRRLETLSEFVYLRRYIRSALAP